MCEVRSPHHLCRHLSAQFSRCRRRRLVDDVQGYRPDSRIPCLLQCLLARQWRRCRSTPRCRSPPLTSEEALQQARDATVRAVALDIIYEAAAAATAELSAEVAAEVMGRAYFTHTFARGS